MRDDIKTCVHRNGTLKTINIKYRVVNTLNVVLAKSRRLTAKLFVITDRLFIIMRMTPRESERGSPDDVRNVKKSLK